MVYLKLPCHLSTTFIMNRDNNDNVKETFERFSCSQNFRDVEEMDERMFNRINSAVDLVFTRIRRMRTLEELNRDLRAQLGFLAMSIFGEIPEFSDDNGVFRGRDLIVRLSARAVPYFKYTYDKYCGDMRSMSREQLLNLAMWVIINQDQRDLFERYESPEGEGVGDGGQGGDEGQGSSRRRHREGEEEDRGHDQGGQSSRQCVGGGGGGRFWPLDPRDSHVHPDLEASRARDAHAAAAAAADAGVSNWDDGDGASGAFGVGMSSGNRRVRPPAGRGREAVRAGQGEDADEEEDEGREEEACEAGSGRRGYVDTDKLAQKVAEKFNRTFDGLTAANSGLNQEMGRLRETARKSGEDLEKTRKELEAEMTKRETAERNLAAADLAANQAQNAVTQAHAAAITALQGQLAAAQRNVAEMTERHRVLSESGDLTSAYNQKLMDALKNLEVLTSLTDRLSGMIVVMSEEKKAGDEVSRKEIARLTGVIETLTRPTAAGADGAAGAAGSGDSARVKELVDSLKKAASDLEKSAAEIRRLTQVLETKDATINVLH